MDTFEKRALEVFGEIVINKSFVHEAGFGSRAIPTYVREWIISHYVAGEKELSDSVREKIATFVHKYMPDKGKRETIKNHLFEQTEVQFLDNFSVYVNLAKGDRYLQIPFLDEQAAFVTPIIVQENEMLLSSGLWGVGKLYYIPPSDDSPKGQIWMREFRPFQLASVDIDYFSESRGEFTNGEWINLLVSSMGFNHQLYSERQKVLLLSRLIPIVEPRYNLVELAPKGTGKSFVFENMSRYVAIRSGSITPAVLFFNDARKTPGLITRYDSVVIDEAQKVKADTSGELTALLKSYLEAGRFGRGSASSISAEAGIVLLANIELDSKQRPLNEETGLFRMFPNFLRETAFIDRISGLLPGWELPKIRKDTPSQSIGLKGDIFGEILHILRGNISFRDYVKLNMELMDVEEMRDSKAIEAGATGLLKIFFPNRNPSEEEFYEYCVNPALEMRQRVRDELCRLDREYTPITMGSKYPDPFQKHHKLPRYVDESERESVEFEIPLLVENGISGPAGEISKLEDQVLHIKEGEPGHSYLNLFGPYLKGATEVVLIDPYIRLAFQVDNFVVFASILEPGESEITLHLVTSADDSYQEQDIREKLNPLVDELARLGIIFTFEFSQTIHARSIKLNNGWEIKLDRGLDIYQKPETRHGLEQLDQTKRNCRETEIIYLRSKD